MAAAKISEVRHNKKLPMIHIKMNRGPNHTLIGEDYNLFMKHKEAFLNAGGGAHFADMYAAKTFLNGSR